MTSNKKLDPPIRCATVRLTAHSSTFAYLHRDLISRKIRVSFHQDEITANAICEQYMINAAGCYSYGRIKTPNSQQQKHHRQGDR